MPTLDILWFESVANMRPHTLYEDEVARREELPTTPQLGTCERETWPERSGQVAGRSSWRFLPNWPCLRARLFFHS